MEFAVSFFSGSWPLTLKSSSKCHQMTSFLFKIMNFSLKHCPHFEWENIINDNFLMTGWELEVKCQRKKEPQMPCCSRIFLKSIFWPLKHDFKTETCNFNLSPWILLEPITILLEIYWNPTKVLMEPVGVLLKHSGVLNWSSAKSLKNCKFLLKYIKKVWKDRSKKLFLPGLNFFCCLGYWMLFNSFDSICSFGNLQKYLKIYCEDKLHRVFFLSELFLV